MLFRRVAVLLAVLVLVPLCAQADGLELIIRPGSTVQSGSLGYRMGALTAYGGLDLVGISAESRSSEVEEYLDPGWYGYREEFESEMSGSAMLFMPHVGGKFAFGHGDVTPYVFGSVFKSFAFVSAEAEYSWADYEDSDGDGVWDDIDSGGGSEELDSELEDALESLLGFWGLNLGVGGQYQMAERFAIGAEFGMRMVFTSTGEISYGDDYHGEMEEWTDTWSEEASASLRMTYATVFFTFGL